MQPSPPCGNVNRGTVATVGNHMCHTPCSDIASADFINFFPIWSVLGFEVGGFAQTITRPNCDLRLHLKLLLQRSHGHDKAEISALRQNKQLIQMTQCLDSVAKARWWCVFKGASPDANAPTYLITHPSIALLSVAALLAVVAITLGTHPACIAKQLVNMHDKMTLW